MYQRRESWPKRVSIAIGRRKHFPLPPHAENEIVFTWAPSINSLHQMLLNSNHRNYVVFPQIYHLHSLVQKLTLTDDESAEKRFGLYKKREFKQPGCLEGGRGCPGELKLLCSKTGLPRVRAAHGGSWLTLQIPGRGDVFCGYLHYTDY